jgi:hypothetical protein
MGSPFSRHPGKSRGPNADIFLITKERRNIMSKKWIYWLGAPLALVLMTTAVWSATYNISVSLDYTGPYAVIMPPFESPQSLDDLVE